MPEFERRWAEHEARWPLAAGDGRADGARQGGPPGAWRGEGGRYLSPAQNAECDRLITALRAPEESVSAVLQRIGQDNAFGGRLAGFEHRLKGEQRLKEKIADGLGKEIGADVTAVVGAIGDAVRYTFCFDVDGYVGGHRDVTQRLEAAGFVMSYSKNHWSADAEYKGINSRWTSPDGGRFELQFHTEESLHAKEHLTHRAYERLRARTTSWTERPELEKFQRLVSAAVPRPDSVAEIPDVGRI